jgi:hypothetical protein
LRLCLNNNEHLTVPNVYSPCDMEEKRSLGHQLYHKFLGDQWSTWCLCDFNAIRSELEQKGNVDYSREEDMQYYNDCVDNRTFIELSLNGSRFI